MKIILQEDRGENVNSGKFIETNPKRLTAVVTAKVDTFNCSKIQLKYIELHGCNVAKSVKHSSYYYP